MQPLSEVPSSVLIVDDHAPNLLALEAVLEPLGYVVVAARSGEEAIALAAAHDFALLLVDAHMPTLDGYETVARIRKQERTRDVPVVFLTAVYDQPEHRARGYALGAIDFIAKPFDRDVLQGKVRAIVALYESGRRNERRRSRELERVKDMFLGGMGHDLRTPLSAISVASQVLIAEENQDPTRRRIGPRLDRAAKRMNAIIDDILDLTRVQLGGGLRLTTGPTNLAEVARAIVDELTLAHPHRVVQLGIEGDVRGTWDAGRVARVLANLVNNAIQHSHAGDVTVRADDIGESVSLSVHNTGEPIAADTLPKIFEPFRRGDTSAEGVGLGLYIVREITQAHGGTVAVTSCKETGTTFTVRLPRSVPAVDPAVP